MKKFISLIILFVFCFQTMSFATEITDKSLENLQAQNIVVKTIDNNDTELKKYLKQNENFLNVEKSFANFSAFNEFDTYEKYKTKSDRRNSNNIVIKLEDGDFIIWDTRLFDRYYNKDQDIKSKYYNYYAFEYHDNGKLMGIIKIKPLKITKNNIKFAFYEYRLNNDGDKYSNTLKHVQIYNIKNKNGKTEISQFIYRNDKYNDDSDENQFNLICYGINNNIYVAEGEKNLIKDLEQYNSKLKSLNETPPNSVKSHVGNVICGYAFILTLPINPLGLAVFWALNGKAKYLDILVMCFKLLCTRN